MNSFDSIGALSMWVASPVLTPPLLWWFLTINELSTLLSAENSGFFFGCVLRWLHTMYSSSHAYGLFWITPCLPLFFFLLPLSHFKHSWSLEQLGIPCFQILLLLLWAQRLDRKSFLPLFHGTQPAPCFVSKGSTILAFYLCGYWNEHRVSSNPT